MSNDRESYSTALNVFIFFWFLRFCSCLIFYVEKVIIPKFFCREEVFGPVAPLVPFKTEEEAIKIANDTNAGTYETMYKLNLTT